MRNTVIAAAVVAMGLCGAASAQDGAAFYFGLDYEDFNDKHSAAPGALIEYASPTFGWNDGFRWRVGGMASTDVDLWAGVGISYEIGRGTSPFFAEFSVMPGVFRRGNAGPGEDDVHFPQIRSLVAVGHRWDDGRTLSLTVSHRSNAQLDSEGSSTETVALRYGIPLGR